MRILILGDIMGISGRKAIDKNLPEIISFEAVTTAHSSAFSTSNTNPFYGRSGLDGGQGTADGSCQAHNCFFKGKSRHRSIII